MALELHTINVLFFFIFFLFIYSALNSQYIIKYMWLKMYIFALYCISMYFLHSSSYSTFFFNWIELNRISNTKK